MANSQGAHADDDEVKKNIAIFVNKQTFEHRHENKSCSACLERVDERVRECESVRLRKRECEIERVTFEHRHENKSCSACQECQVLQVPSFCLTFRHF